jgi:tRNA(Ile)-lysidine synthase
VSPEIARRTVINRDHHLRLSEPAGFLAALRAVLDAWAASGPPPRLTVAFSGGLDSTVLLAALCRLGFPARVRAAHVDHGLNAQSASWSEHCAAAAHALGAEFVSVRVAVNRASGQGLEAAARDVRYSALRDVLDPGEWLLTAHHADDQLETLLLRILRGTGVRGLRGIIAFGPFGAGSMGRPLLQFTRAELHAQARAWSLRWLEDPSNREPRHDRNYLRLNVLPALLARWPGAAHQAERLAAQMTEAEQLLDAVAAADARLLDVPWCLPRAVLAALDPVRQRNLLRHLLRRVGIGVPSARKIDELRHALLAASADSHPLVRWSSGEGRVFREHLHLLAPLPPASAPGYTAKIGFGESWTGPEGRIGFVPAQGGDGLPASWLQDGLTLRFRAGGERFRPRGRRHHRTLKHLFQEHAVVPWMRERVPLLYRGETLAAVGDLWVSADVEAALESEPCWCVQWADHPVVRAPGQR